MIKAIRIERAGCQFDGEHYRVVATIMEPAPARIPPFESIEMDLAYVLGD